MNLKDWLMSFFISLVLASTIMNIYSISYGFNPQAHPMSIICFLLLLTFALMSGINIILEGINELEKCKEVS